MESLFFLDDNAKLYCIKIGSSSANIASGAWTTHKTHKTIYG